MARRPPEAPEASLGGEVRPRSHARSARSHTPTSLSISRTRITIASSFVDKTRDVPSRVGRKTTCIDHPARSWRCVVVLVSYVRTTALVLVLEVKRRPSPAQPHSSTRHIRSTSRRRVTHLISLSWEAWAPTAHSVTALSFPDDARNWPFEENARRSTPPTCATHS